MTDNKNNSMAILSKTEVRKAAKEFRKSISAEKKAELDEDIYERLTAFLTELNTEKYGFTCKEITDILAYVSYGREVDTHKLIGELTDYKSSAKESVRKGINVLAPRVHGDTMDFYYINSFDDLEPGCMGILEPKEYCKLFKYAEYVNVDAECTQETAINTHALYNNDDSACAHKAAIVIMPGLAFTKNGKRCGYGGGFYDKYLSGKPDLLKVGLCYEGQIFDDFETDDNDIKVDCIVTEKEIVNANDTKI